MVLPSSTAAEGEAPPPEWLSELRRWLHLGRKGVIVLIRDAQQSRLRELVEALEEIEPGFTFTTRAEDLAECTPGALVLLALREVDLDWLNLNRPILAQRRLRAVLWADRPLSEVFRFRAPDLHDWVSHFVLCPPGMPRFAIEGLRVGLRWWPGVAWRGEGLDLALEQEGLDTAVTLNPEHDFAEMVSTLSSSRRGLVRWVGVNTARGLWRVRWALARARHYGPNVLDNPAIEAPGWFEVHSQQLDLVEAAAQLQRVGIAAPCRTAARLELEPGPMEELVEAGPSLDRVATLQAAPHLQRTLQEHPEVLETRRALVREMRSQPTSHHWSRFELGVFATLERDRIQWPDWDLRLSPWKIEHKLRIGASPEDRRIILSMLLLMEEPAIERSLAAEWKQQPMHSRAFHARDAWLDAAASSDSISGDDIDSEQLRQQAESLLDLANGVGWDAGFVIRTLTQILRFMIAMVDRAALVTFIDRVLRRAASQLGDLDPGYVTISRIGGFALGAAGLFERASELLQDSWDRLSPTNPMHDELAADLAMALAARGRFSSASQLLESIPDLDEDITLAHRFVRLATGEGAAASLSGLESFDIGAATRRYFEQRLFTFVQPDRA